MASKAAKEKFYGPLKQVAKQYLPMLMARLKVLEDRSLNAMDFLDAESDIDHEFVWEFDESEVKPYMYFVNSLYCLKSEVFFSDLKIPHSFS